MRRYEILKNWLQALLYRSYFRIELQIDLQCNDSIGVSRVQRMHPNHVGETNARNKNEENSPQLNIRRLNEKCIKHHGDCQQYPGP